MMIIGGDFNAELGPGEGVELSCVGHYTPNKANCRGEWMTQWLLEKNLVALNTIYKKLPYKQVTYHAPKGGKKQLDYILTDRKHYGWSKDAEANDTIDMGSDHRCVMAKFEISKKPTKTTRRDKVPSVEIEGETGGNEHESMCKDLEQEVKVAEPEKTQKKAAEAKATTIAEAQAVATVTAVASSAAADGKTITKINAEATEASEAASEAQGTEGEDKEILAFIQERKTTAKHEKERNREISKKIKKCIREKKGKKRQGKIRKILENFKGTRNILNIKSMKKRVLIPKVKNKKGETINTKQEIANVFAEFYESLYEGEDDEEEKKTESRTEQNERIPDQHDPIPEFTKKKRDSRCHRSPQKRKSKRQQWNTS